MNLYFQVLTQFQTVEVARLLLLPAELQSDPSGCQLIISGGGKILRRRYQALDRAVADVQSFKFNELEARYSIRRDTAFRMSGTPVSVVGLLTVSPTCDLWFKAENWLAGGERAVRNRKMNAKARELGLRHYKVSRAPSILEFVLETDTTEPKDKVLDACAEWLAAFIPKPLGPLAIFGCVDAGGPEYFVKIESNVLMTEHIRMMANLRPPAYPELGQRFDALHPVMFGSKEVCEGIGAALGKQARVIPGGAVRDLAVIRLGAGCELPDAHPRVSRWILPCVGETAGIEPGEQENAP